MTLTVGDLAPDFELPNAEGEVIKSQDLRGKWVVLYFYPRDNTPGCTKEACGFREAYADYQDSDIVVLGVSTDDAKSHTKFATKHNLPFPLLVDEGGAIASSYGSYGLKKFMGKEYMGITRSTFVINPEGHLAKIYRKVKPEPHAQEVLADIAALSAST
ncbi:thioredoxin-dependent thiol peroxidase [Oscillatoria sp. CS-180]|uniref:thioredoxin-dependent thiol peroxidase n=1 Tax=Oscillatoria sp. CS-180 TaxID=3021720 RepID=UPI00232B34FF|nr:thioredoxin-dependent thiol peroxidase [Oscillatoria sp. CS-180]MDB9527992.1 thioredoxin-dependent thiol peroxidase [Oscillatoria sp. CS-180]